MPVLSGPGKGVILKRVSKDDRVVVGACVDKDSKVKVIVENGSEREILVKELHIAARAQKGNKVVKRGAPVVSLSEVTHGRSQLVLLH